MVNNQKIKESFGNISRELGLRSLLFALLFYVVASPIVYKYLDKNVPRGIEVLAIQAVVFGIVFYVVNLYL